MPGCRRSGSRPALTVVPNLSRRPSRYLTLTYPGRLLRQMVERTLWHVLGRDR